MERLLVLVVLLLLPASAGTNVGQARHTYQGIWKQDRAMLGAKGQPAPRMVFGAAPDGVANGTSTGPGGVRTIYLGRGTRRGLKLGNSSARFLVEHELARVYQPDSVIASPLPNAGAGVANAVANHLARFRNTGKGDPKSYNRNHLSYFGQNPRTIHWPLVTP